MRDEISREHERLRADIALVRGYGEAHPEAWIESRFENEPTVHIVALFAGDDLEVHAAELRRLVAYPDQLEVRWSPLSNLQLEKVRADIHEMAISSDPGLIGGWVISDGRVNVRLRADGELVAAQLRQRYGNAVDLTVGFLRYPDGSYRESFGVLTARLEPTSLLQEDLRIVVEERLEVQSGANLRSAVQVFNDSSQEVVVHTNGQITARVVDPETKEIVGLYSGPQAMPRVSFRAPAGGSVEMPLLIGTASTVPRLGFAVPPGRWAIEIALALGALGMVCSPLIPLQVVP